MSKSQDMYKIGKKLIPGGTQLLSKRPEMYLPEQWPSYFREAKGCEIWDMDGNKYVDMSNMSVGACILGYADDDVNRAVIDVINKGNMTSLNCPEEIELAKILLQLHPWAQMARYARGGGEAMAVAVRIARAKTQKDIVLFCGYHGWHDWYLSANLLDGSSLNEHLLPGLDPNGVPKSLKGSSYPFKYNDTEQFLELVKLHKGKIAAVVMEAVRNDDPNKDFLSAIKESTKDQQIVLIVDEVSSGFRLTLGGAHLVYNIEPDVAVFSKGMSNGFPMAAVIGKANVMEAAQTSFISSTYWTDRIGPTAAIASIAKMGKNNVPEHLIKCGTKIQNGWKDIASKAGLKISIGGIPPLGHFSFEDGEPLVIKTLFTQEMLEKGYLATTAYYSSYAHKDLHINGYLSAAEDSFKKIKKAVDSGNPKTFLKGPVCHSGFKRLN